MAALSANPDVEYAEPDYIAVPAAYPDDPRYGEQWALDKIEVEGAWNVVTGAPAVAIAIVDSGVDLAHADLAPNLWVNPGEIASNGTDDDGNRYVDDVHGWNFVAGSSDVADDSGHGTLVTGVAAARTNNGIGIAGVCGNCRFMPVKVMQPSGIANYSDIAAGVVYATAKGARVINLSLGGYADSKTLRDAITNAVSQNIVVVGGAGNDGVGTPFYPAAYENVLAVAGTGSGDKRTATSNFGPWVDVSAPGEAILTTALGGDYVTTSGTSIAAPFASGLAGLLLTLHPDWTPALVRSQLMHTADPVDALNPGYAGLLGSGRINATGAVKPPEPLLAYAGYSANGVTNGRPDFGADASLVVSVHNEWADAPGVVGTLTTSDPYVTITSGSASYGDILSGQTAANATPFAVTIAGAGYSHAMPFQLHLSANGGAAVTTLAFTVTTRSSLQPVSGTIAQNTVWTHDKTYLVNGNVGIAPGFTLTIEPGTWVRFNGNYALNVGGTLIADGTEAAPIVFTPNTAGGTWNRIYFDDPSADAVADEQGNYLGGNILRWVRVEGAASGIACTAATPYLSHVTLTGGGVGCEPGSTPLWLLESNLTGSVTANLGARVWDSVVTGGGLSVGAGSSVLRNVVNGNLSAGSGIVRDNTVTGGDIHSGVADVIGNTVTRGGVTVDGSAGETVQSVVSNTVSGGGIRVGLQSVVAGNDIRRAADWGIASSGVMTATGNRLVDNANGIRMVAGRVQGNLIASSAGTGLEINGSATVISNTFTANAGSAIKIVSATALQISGNNLEFNTGTYDVENLVPKSTLATIAAQGNWWGGTDSTAIQQRIFDFYTDYTKGQVVFSPVRSTPSPDAPAYVRAVTLTPASPVGIQTIVFDVLFSREMETASMPQLSFESASGLVWTSRASMPTARAWSGVAAASNGKIYIIGSISADERPSSSVEEYDPATDTWATRASMPTARGSLGVVAASNGRIYAIGGYGETGFLSMVEEYDPSTDAWDTRSSMPTARIGLGLAAASNGKIYAIGGQVVGNNGTAIVEEYDPATDTWATRASMPTARYNLGVAAVGNGKIYAIGGNRDILGTVEEYDPATDTWATRARMPTARASLGVVTASNGEIYAIGGTGGGYLGTVEEYDPATDTWATRGSMPTARAGLGVVSASNGRIYAVGGTNSDGPLRTVEEAALPFESAAFYAGQWLTASQHRAAYDFATLVPRGAHTLSVSAARGTDGIEIAPYSGATFTVDYAGSITDKTPPARPSVMAWGNGTLNTLSATWTTSDPESSINLYRYAIGTTPGGVEVVNWTDTPGTSLTRGGLSLAPGQPYYVAVKARNTAGLWSEPGVSAGVIDGAELRVLYVPLVLRGK